MKNFILLSVTLILSSCVTMKKYKATNLALQKTTQELDNTKKTLSDYVGNNGLMGRDLESSKDKLKTLEEHLHFVKATNEDLTKRIDLLSNSTQINMDIMKRTLEELNAKNQQISQLSAVLQKKDSVNVLLVRKVSSKLSDSKFKRSLKKMGFIF